MDTMSIEKGFYYHYKHNHEQDKFHYVYDVLGTALHTETGAVTVIYRPLYVSEFIGTNNFYSRPIDMFIEQVRRGTESVQRFTKIEDQTWIEILTKK